MLFKMNLLPKRVQAFNLGLARFVPHSFLYVIFFTFFCYLLGVFGAYQGPFEMVRFWVNGFWSLLGFAMQMVLMVLTGFSVASVPWGQKILRYLAGVPKTPRRAVMFLTGATAVISWIHWGIGMVVGAFLAREMGKKIRRIDYPLLVAGAYIGMAAGRFGIFAWEPLSVSQAGHLFEKSVGVIPLAQTSMSAMVLSAFGLGTLMVIALVGLAHPQGKDAVPPSPEVLKRFEEEDTSEIDFFLAEKELRKKGGMPPGVWLEHSRWPVWLLSIMGFSYIVYWFYGKGLDLNINMLNFVLLFLALALHDTPLRFMKSMEKSTRIAYGIIVQFPFYAGIQGMLASSGLAAILFRWFTANSSAAMYPFWVYLDAVFINLFAPTAEGVWGIQGSLVIKTAQDLNAVIPRAISAFTAGEVIGNLIQPFWAIPLLSICGLSLRYIMGYCLLAFILLSMLWLLCVTLLPL